MHRYFRYSFPSLLLLPLLKNQKTPQKYRTELRLEFFQNILVGFSHPLNIPLSFKMQSQNQDIPEDSNDEIHDASFAGRGCCFCIPCFGTNRAPVAGSVWWERIGPTELKKNEPWWFRGWMKLREWSELAAGPRWKTFIRTFRKNRGCWPGCCGCGNSRPPKFQYDPLSYARNFDEGPVQNGQFVEDDVIARDFTLRYASVSLPASSKSSMDLEKDAPPSTWSRRKRSEGRKNSWLLWLKRGAWGITCDGR